MARLNLGTDLLGRVDLEGAIESTIGTPPDLLPKPTLDAAVAANREEATGYLRGLIGAGLEQEPAEIVYASKGGHGLRPVSVLTFQDRVTLTALARAVAQQVPAVRRGIADYDEFVRAPLEAEDASYVVLADVTAFYEYVDHDLLRTEIVSQTGDVEAADGVSAALTNLMNRRFGLPQGYEASDVFSELVIDIAERQMLRQGWQVWRYNDDFRIATQSWRQASQAIESLARELRAIGLTLNDAKTYAIRAARYRDWTQRPEQVWNEFSEAADVTGLGGFLSDLYPEETQGEIDPRPDIVDTAMRALEAVGEGGINGEATGLDELTGRRIASRALTLLQLAGSADGLRHCGMLWKREPGLAIKIARYMELGAAVAPEAANGALEAILNDGAARSRGWSAAELVGVPLTTNATSPAIIGWLRDRAAGDGSDLARARCALALSRHREIDENETLRILQTSHEASKPEAARAVAIASMRAGSNAAESVRRESPWLRWVIDSEVPPAAPTLIDLDDVPF